MTAHLTRAYDWSKTSGGGGARPLSPGASAADAAANAFVRTTKRFAASEDRAATDRLVEVVGRALATDPVTLAYAIPGKEQRYCEAALRAGLLSDSVGRDRRLWLSACGRAAAVAYLCVGGGAESSSSSSSSSSAPLPRPPPLPMLAGAQRAALTAQALTSLRPGEPARACARAATAMGRVRAAYCAAVERSVGGGGGGERDDDDLSLSSSPSSSSPSSRCCVAYVSVLAVDPSAQGKGLGTRLLRAVLRELLLVLPTTTTDEEEVPALPAAQHAYVEASSERSAALYERLGFRVIACVDADGSVARSASSAPSSSSSSREEVEEAGGGGRGARYFLPDAPTLVMAAELKGRFREWLLAED